MSGAPEGTQLGGLRREHLVASALVAVVTVVLGFASGLGVLDAGATDIQQVAPAGPPGEQPGEQAAPAGGQPAAGAVHSSGTRTGAPPARPSTPPPAASGFGASSAGPPVLVVIPPGPPAGAGTSAPAPAPQCTPGLLDQLLALVTQVLGGTAPARALSDSGAVLPRGGMSGAAAGEPVLLPSGDGFVPVAGLMPLLQTVADRQQVRIGDAVSPLLGAEPAPAPAAAPAPAPGAEPVPAASVEKLGQLAVLLAPLGLYMDPGTGTGDALLAPVLGSLGCSGLAPAAAPGPVR